MVTVTDTGAEIPPQKLEMIFEKFYRLDSSRSTGTGGAGLGLSIARQIVEAHGGELAAESRGGVTVFTVRLPLRARAKRKRCKRRFLFCLFLRPPGVGPVFTPPPAAVTAAFL